MFRNSGSFFWFFSSNSFLPTSRNNKGFCTQYHIYDTLIYLYTVAKSPYFCVTPAKKKKTNRLKTPVKRTAILVQVSWLAS